jgi:hypothetical protein
MQNEFDNLSSFFLLILTSLLLFSSSSTAPPLFRFLNTRRFPRTTSQPHFRGTAFLGQEQHSRLKEIAPSLAPTTSCAISDNSLRRHKPHRRNASLRETDGVPCPRCMSPTHPSAHLLSLELDSSSTQSAHSKT